jgi:hypothetical protein
MNTHDPLATGAQNVLGIDVRIDQARKLISALSKRPTTITCDGPFQYPSNPVIAQVHVTTAWNKEELDRWLHKAKHGSSTSGTFKILNPVAARDALGRL